MSYNLANEEEAIDHMDLLPQIHFLQSNRRTKESLIRFTETHIVLSHRSPPHSTDLVACNLHQHFPEQVCWATRPPVLLIPVSLQSTRQLILNLNS